jgi:polyphosphate kinase 2 (PPK2 family)
MDYRKKFIVEPGAKVRLSKIDPSYMGKHESHEKAVPEIQKNAARMDKLQYLLYADGSQSLLVVLQALDAAGKDGVIRHVFSGSARNVRFRIQAAEQRGGRARFPLAGPSSHAWQR